MRFLLKWLRIERPAGVALHPSRTVDVPLPPADAFSRCTSIVTDVLGGTVTSEDPPHSLEASFGLVHSERISVTITELDASRSAVTIQSRRLPAPDVAAAPSQYVARFERELRSYSV